jgi:hypothetical protein
VTGQALLVAPGRPGAHATIAGALLSATDGALIQLAAGTYAEELVITAPVTLAAEGDPGTVRIHAPGGSAIVAEAAVRLSGLAVSGEDAEAPVIDVCDGAVEFDACQVSGRAWAAVLVRDTGTVSLRDCEIGNDYGAGIVIASAGGNVVSDTVIRDVASSGIVVAGDGRLTLLRARLERPGGNGIIVNGQAHVVAEDTSVTRAVKPAVAVEEDAGADLTRLAVTTDTGPGAYLAGLGPITLTDCSFQVRDASQPAVLVAEGAAPRCDGLTVTGGAAGVRVDDGAVMTLMNSDISADGDGIQVLDGGTLTATQSRLNGAGGLGLNVAPAGHADVKSCDADADADIGDEGDPGDRVEPAPAAPAAEPAPAMPAVEPALAAPGDEPTESVADEPVPPPPAAAEFVPSPPAAAELGVPAPVPPERVLPGPEVPEPAVPGPTVPEGTVPEPEGPELAPPDPAVPGPALSQDTAPAAAEPETDPAADLELSPSVRLIGDLVGLDSVRRAVSGLLTDLVRLRASGQPLHAEVNLAFAGHDGSGRRAVAELYARALAELGFLRTGTLDWAPLTDFPARWPGQADRYADWLLTRSYGGLLLLEANDIFGSWPEDRRTRVLAALPGAVRRFPDAVIVLSGVPDLLSAALRDDPDLAECFPTQVQFDPYAPAELAELTIRRLTARGCGIGDGVRAALTGYFGQEQATVVSGATGAWDAHRLAVYLGDVAHGPEITPADLFSAMRGELDNTPTDAAPRLTAV